MTPKGHDDDELRNYLERVENILLFYPSVQSAAGHSGPCLGASEPADRPMGHVARGPKSDRSGVTSLTAVAALSDGRAIIARSCFMCF